jgi:hypothetical protein
LPLAVFSAFSYPSLWVGISGGAIDILVGAGTAHLVSRYRVCLTSSRKAAHQ